MEFVANDICYMIETGKIVKVKVMRKQGNTYISKALIRMVVKNQLNQGFADSRQTVLL